MSEVSLVNPLREPRLEVPDHRLVEIESGRKLTIDVDFGSQLHQQCSLAMNSGTPR